MAKAFEYIFNLKDNFTNKLNSISGASSRVFANLTNKNNAFIQKNDKVGTSISGIQSKLNQLKTNREISISDKEIRQANIEIRKLERELKRLDNLPPNGFIGGLRDLNGFIGNIGGAAMGAGAAFAAWEGIKSVANLGMDMEQTQISFEVMLGSMDKSKKMIADLDNFANVTPFDNAELYENAKLLMNFGIEGKKIIPTLQMLGDVSGGNKEKLHSLSLAYAQVQSAGKLTGGDLLQMTNAGFNPLFEIYKKTGKSMTKLRDEMSKGLISFEQIEDVFKSATSEGGRFHNMMNKQSETARGKLSTLLGTIKTKATNVGMALIPTFTKLIDFAMELVKAIESLYHWYKKYASIINVVVSAVFIAVAAYKSYILIVGAVKAITIAWAGAQKILNVVMALNPIGLIIAGIALLIAAITYVIMKTDGWAKQWTNFKNMFVASLDIMNSYFAIIWRNLVMEFGNAADGIVLTWKKAQNAIGLISDTELANEKIRINAQMQAREDAIRKAEIANMQAKKDFNQANKWELTWNKNANFKKVKDKISQSLGIDTKTDENTVNNEDTNITNTANDITSGGSKQTNITINLGKLHDNINIYSQNVKEGINDMQEQIETALLRVLNSTNSLATN